jgi:replication factor A1
LKVVQNRQYSAIKNPYEITFNINSEIYAAHDDIQERAPVYNFVPISTLAMVDPNATVDIIAVVREATAAQDITSKAGKNLQKRDLTLVDDSSSEIKLTLWGEKATANYDWASHPIAAFKGVKVGDYGGRSLSSLNSSTILLNPNLPEALRIHNWRSQYSDGSLPITGSLSNASGRYNCFSF